jgi:hypothetical protein
MRVPVPWTSLIHVRFRLLDGTLLPDFPGGELRSMLLRAVGELAVGRDGPPSVVCRPRPEPGTRWTRVHRLRARPPGHEVAASLGVFTERSAARTRPGTTWR